MCDFPWKVVFTRHALDQTRARWGLESDEEAEAFLLHHLSFSGTARTRHDGALRWTADCSLCWEDGGVQIVTTPFSEDTLTVLTAYPMPEERAVRKVMSCRIRDRRIRKAAHERRKLARRTSLEGPGEISA